MQPDYVSVIDPATMIPTAAAMLIHLAVAATQLAIAVLMLTTGARGLLSTGGGPVWSKRLFDVRGATATPGFSALQIALGLLLLLPLLLGAPALLSLAAGAGILALLILAARGASQTVSQDSSKAAHGTRRLRRVAMTAVAAVALFTLWEGEDGLALGVDLTTNMAQWRAREIDWQLTADVDAPKIGEMAPDFQLQDPTGVGGVRLSEFRDKRPVILIFGSYT